MVTEAAKMPPRNGSDSVTFTTNTVIRNLARRIQALNTDMRSIHQMLNSSKRRRRRCSGSTALDRTAPLRCLSPPETTPSGSNQKGPGPICMSRAAAPAGKTVGTNDPHISAAISGGHCNVSASLSDGVIQLSVCRGRVLSE